MTRVEYSADLDPVLESIARQCAAPIRGCATDEQYIEVVRRVALALQAEIDDRTKE